MRILGNCQICNNEFLLWMSTIRKGGGKFCSKKCFHKSQSLGNINTWKGGISKVINNCEVCGKKTSDYRYKRCGGCAKKGIKLKEDHREKVIKTLNRKKGKECNLWNGGVSSLQKLIRYSTKSKEWRNEIFKRDNYTCQDCGIRGSYIEAHHNKSFKKIFNSFIKKYNNFSVIEDKEVLVRLSENYEEFWDISNGETLCKSCHNKTKEGRPV